MEQLYKQRTNHMNKYYFRNTDGEFYLVPIKKIKTFDELVEKMGNGDELAVTQFNENFRHYKMEGELYDIVLSTDAVW